MISNHCSFCHKPLRKSYGLDLLGRSYCKRITCKISIWIDRHIEIKNNKSYFQLTITKKLL
jgi:hypothetical protein